MQRRALSVAVMIGLLAACREPSVPGTPPRAVAFGRIAPSDLRGCFELSPDHAGAAVNPLGAPGAILSYEPPPKFEFEVVSDVATQLVARALARDSNGVLPRGSVAMSSEQVVIGWSGHPMIIRRYPDGALRAVLDGRRWLVKRTACEPN